MDQLLHLGELLGLDLLVVTDVEAKAIGRDQRSFLLDMISDHLAKSGME